MKRILKLAGLAFGTAALAGCVVVPRGYGYYPYGYYSDAAPGGPVAQAPQQPAPPVAPATPLAGVVTDIRVFNSGPAYTTGGGAVVGTVTGAIVGRQFGSGPAGRAVGTLIGALGGAVIGNEIERQSSGAGRPPIYRVTVRMDGGGVRSYDYASLNNLRVGDRVRDEGGQLYRD
jgi:outer membrane lipoprotein SlyB